MVLGAPDFVGQQVSGGRYQVLAKIGAGGMAVVYKALDRNLNYEVVLKVPRPAVLQDERSRARFLMEIRALVRLNHPHIVKVLDAGEHEGWPYAVLQYLPGGSLRDKARGPGTTPRPMPPDSLRGWLLSIADALDFIHGQGMVHRDVKPDNILFDQHGNAYLGDFGIAKALTSQPGEGTPVLTGAGFILGTAQYMAPEIIQDKPFGGAADQYSLGLTVFELVTGKNPFANLTLSAIIARQITQGPPSLVSLAPTLPPRVLSAVDQALAMDPVRRHGTCADFARAVLGMPQKTALAGPPLPTPGPARAKTVPSPAPAPTGPRFGDVQATCPACATGLVLTHEALGRKVRCPRCSTSFFMREDGRIESKHAAAPPKGPAGSRPSQPPPPPPPPPPPASTRVAHGPARIPPAGGETQPHPRPHADTPSVPISGHRPPAPLPPKMWRPSSGPPPWKRRRNRWLLLVGSLLALVLLGGLIFFLWPAKKNPTVEGALSGRMTIEFVERDSATSKKATYTVDLKVRHDESSEVAYKGNIILDTLDGRKRSLTYHIALSQNNLDGGGKVLKTNPLGNFNGKAFIEDDETYDFSRLERLLPGGAEKIRGKMVSAAGEKGEEIYQFLDLYFPPEEALGLPGVTVRGALEYERTRKSFKTKNLVFDYGKESDHLVGTIQWYPILNHYVREGAKRGDPIRKDDADFGKSKYVIKIAFRSASLPAAKKEDLNIGPSESYLAGEVHYKDWGLIHKTFPEPRIFPDGSEVTYSLDATRLTPRQIHTFVRVWLFLARPVNDEDEDKDEAK